MSDQGTEKPCWAMTDLRAVMEEPVHFGRGVISNFYAGL